MISKRLKDMRIEKGLSQRELSEKIHCNQNTISQYESNKRNVTTEVLENITDVLDYDIHFIKKSDKSFKKSIVKTFNHLELIEEMNKAILNKTGINMNFEFELSSDGNLDLYVKHNFSENEVNKLIKLDWFNESILGDFKDSSESSPFNLDDELNLSNNLFIFILEKTFGEGSEVVGVINLDEYIELNISVPI